MEHEFTGQNKIQYEEDKRHYNSGATTSGNVPPYECLTKTFLQRSANRMKLGLHYGKHNWKKGAHDKSFILDRLNHAIEHLHKAITEIDNNVSMSDDDLAAVVVNCMFAMEYQTSSLNECQSSGESNLDYPNPENIRKKEILLNQWKNNEIVQKDRESQVKDYPHQMIIFPVFCKECNTGSISSRVQHAILVHDAYLSISKRDLVYLNGTIIALDN